MARRQREWAKRQVIALKTRLGGKCVECGSDDFDDLQFDHLAPRDYEPRRIEWSHRISIYRREINEGKIQLLCSTCNRRKGHPGLLTDPPHIPLPD